VRDSLHGRQQDQGATRLSFDRLAAIFDDQRGLPPNAVAALHRAFAQLHDGGVETLIEPGAGTGRIAIPALAAGLRVTALDISTPMLDTLRSRLAPILEVAGRCAVVTGDATELPFDDDTFGAGVLAQVLYLIPHWQRALDELVRVVRSGGKVLLVQERTSMSSALTRWDAAWRDATVGAGYEPFAQVPDDETAVAALLERTTDVGERDLASWTFGQTVGEALAGLDRIRALYVTLDDAAWQRATGEFRAWHAMADLSDGTRLEGTVTLTLVSGTVTAGS
jgi:ubiquinone/menaquinone biosynthesis C-methylase UbiE